MIMRAIAGTLALPILIAAPLHTSASDAILDNAVWNAFVEEKIEKDNPPGLAVAVVKGAETGYKNWGYANIWEQAPVTEEIVFGIGSCSKAFAALSIFLLQEDDKLSIEDSVSDYLPWWNVTWNGQPQDTKLWQLLEQSGAADWKEAAELIHTRHMLTLAQMQITASGMRRESRGVFFRTDYPETDEAHWRCNIVIRRRGAEMAFSTRPAICDTQFD